MATISCSDPHGTLVPVSEDKITFRPAAYGIYVENGEALLLRDEATTLLRPLGGILGPGDTLRQRVSSAFQRLTGYPPLISSLLFVEELFRIDENGRAWRLSVMYYHLERPLAATYSFTLDEAYPRPELHPVDSIERRQLQFGFEAIQVARLRLRTSGPPRAE